MISKEELLECARKIVNNCNALKSNCGFTNCAFYNKSHARCSFAHGDGFPFEWELSKFQLNQKEYNILKCFYDFGFNTISREQEGFANVYKTSNGDTSALPYGSFKTLTFQEIYDISEILEKCEIIEEEEK